MLVRQNRLRLGRDIDRVMSRGRYCAGSGLYAKVLTKPAAETRLVVVVGKKVSKKAVTRNRIRRRICGYFERIWETVGPGYDIVIVIREDLSDLPTPELETRLKQLARITGLTAGGNTHV